MNVPSLRSDRLPTDVPRRDSISVLAFTTNIPISGIAIAAMT
jgi:hypothetical protein